MREVSSPPYPDGLALYLGTMFVPSKDRGEKGKGFTHKVGDIVTIATPKLGSLVNRVLHTDKCPPWTFGASHLMRNLARRNLIGILVLEHIGSKVEKPFPDPLKRALLFHA